MVRPTQAPKPTERKVENNNNHTNPQHPQHHHGYHMHPNMHPKNDAYDEKHTNNALQTNICWSDQLSSTTSEII